MRLVVANHLRAFLCPRETHFGQINQQESAVFDGFLLLLWAEKKTIRRFLVMRSIKMFDALLHRAIKSRERKKKSSLVCRAEKKANRSFDQTEIQS